ncbi:MAG: Gas vesicle protein G [Pelotomaculum sp. PtaU1.Bin035]|nr:MAG: Gas vesicle protein G [Pelotomaculum sp. PtaU1.Bin035]
MFILDNLIMSPWRFFSFIVEEIYNRAMAELTDESLITREMLEVQVRYDMGEVSDDEYGKLEEELVGRLRAAREFKMQLAEEESEFEESEDFWESE